MHGWTEPVRTRSPSITIAKLDSHDVNFFLFFLSHVHASTLKVLLWLFFFIVVLCVKNYYFKRNFFY